MTFSCETCSISFSKKSNYDRHLLSQKHKKREKGRITMYQCTCCNRYFTSQYSMDVHTKKCDANTNPPDVVNQLLVQNQMMVKNQEMMVQTIEKKDKQIEILTQQISVLLEKGMSNSSSTTNNTTNNIETQNVIVVNSFGNENTEYLSDRIVSRLIKSGPFTCLPKIIEKIHFDPDHPENHNIKVTNQKNNYAKIIKNNIWVTTDKKKAIDTMIQNSYDILEEKYNDNKDSIPDFKKERFEDFQHKYQENDKELMKNIKGDVDIAIINGTDKIHK